MSKLVLISYTGEHASGGVPRWIRDFKTGFPEAVSYSAYDIPRQTNIRGFIPEFNIAAGLNTYLRHSGKITKDDIIVVDGFWGKGLEDFPNVISVCHGIWSHLIKEEADAGKKPDNSEKHAVQVNYRRKHLERGGRLVAVSQFIQHQMKIQWGFESEIINNAIDLDVFKPTPHKTERAKKLIIHGVNDKGNENKGWSHIEYLKDSLPDVEILSLDEAFRAYEMSRKQSSGYSLMSDGKDLTKYEVLGLADCVVIPSAFEGNSYFCLEALACDVPVFGYDVGLLWELSPFNPSMNQANMKYTTGYIKSRKIRFPNRTLEGVMEILEDDGMSPPWKTENKWLKCRPREVAKNYSIQKFHEQWRTYLKKEFNYES